MEKSAMTDADKNAGNLSRAKSRAYFQDKILIISSALAAACIVTTLLLFSTIFDQFLVLMSGREEARAFIVSSFMASTMVALILLKYKIADYGPLNKPWCGFLLAALSLTGGYVSPPSLIFYAVFGGIFGIGFLLAFIKTGSFLSLLSELQRIKIIALGCIIAAGIKFFSLFVPSAFSIAIISVCCFIVPFFYLALNGSNLKEYRVEYSSLTPDKVRGSVERNWLSFSGLLLSVYTIACMYSAVYNGEFSAIAATFNSEIGVIVGFVLTSITTIFIARKRDANIIWFYQITPVVSVTLLIISWLFSGVAGEFKVLLTSLPWGLSSSIFGIIVAVRLSNEIAMGMRPSFVYGLGLALGSLFSIAVFVTWPLFGDEIMRLVHSSLLVILLAATIIQSIVFSQQTRTMPVEKTVYTSADICRQLSSQYGLSERESQILDLVAVGRGIPYIAETLFLSKNTVKTHVRRIYQKMDVHTREELLDLVHDRL